MDATIQGRGDLKSGPRKPALGLLSAHSGRFWAGDLLSTNISFSHSRNSKKAPDSQFLSSNPRALHPGGLSLFCPRALLSVPGLEPSAGYPHPVSPDRPWLSHIFVQRVNKHKKKPVHLHKQNLFSQKYTFFPNTLDRRVFSIDLPENLSE